jgi:DNA modification methylase
MYLTHGIHHYTARMIPQIPSYFILKYSEKNNLILDPFCGSGTTLLEARLLGRNAIGIDINPLAVLISEVKSNTLDTVELARVMESVEGRLFTSEESAPRFPNIDYWFCERAKKELAAIKHVLESSRVQDERIRQFLLLCFSAIIRRSSRADPCMAKTYRSKRVLEKIQQGWVPTPIKYFKETLSNNFKRMEALYKCTNMSENFAKALPGDAKEIEAILGKESVEKVDFIITSPPYINAQDYFRSYKLEIWWLGLATPEEIRKLEKRAIGTEIVSGPDQERESPPQSKALDVILGSISRIDRKKGVIVWNYFKNMTTVLEQCKAVLNTNGHLCLVTGDNTICNTRIPTHRILNSVARDIGFELVERVRNKIRTRTLPPKRNHGAGFIKEEWITVYRKVDN